MQVAATGSMARFCIVPIMSPSWQRLMLMRAPHWDSGARTPSVFQLKMRERQKPSPQTRPGATPHIETIMDGA